MTAARFSERALTRGRRCAEYRMQLYTNGHHRRPGAMGPARKAGRVRPIRRAAGALPRSETVYAELRQAILPGATRAEAEGLAAALPRRGLAVAEVSPEHVMEIYLVREVLEGAASRLAARHVTHLEAARLEKLLEGMQDAAARDDTPAMEALNRRFHSLIYRAAQNRLIQRVLGGLWDGLGWV